MNVGLFEEIPLHIYPFPIFFSIGQEDDDFIASLTDVGITLPDSFIEDKGYYAKVWTSQNAEIVFRVKTYPTTYYEIGAISHDAFHCVCSAMKLAGGWLEDASEESYAYLLGYIVAQITEKYSEKLHEVKQ